MSLSVNVTSDTDVVVVALVGAADAAMLTPLEAPLRAALADTQMLVLDLDELTGVDGDELRAVLLRLLDARGGQLRIAANHPEMLAALAAARIHHLVGVHRTVAEAVSVRDESVW